MTKDYINPKLIDWCCQKMHSAIDSMVYPIDLELVTRTYYIPSMWPHGDPWLKVDFCPWCTTALPDLEEIRWEILEKEYGVTRANDIWTADPKIPSEFYCEDWWIERGL